VEPIPTVALIETVEFYLKLISTSIEVLFILLNTKDRSSGACYQHLQQYQTLP